MGPGAGGQRLHPIDARDKQFDPHLALLEKKPDNAPRTRISESKALKADASKASGTAMEIRSRGIRGSQDNPPTAPLDNSVPENSPQSESRLPDRVSPGWPGSRWGMGAVPRIERSRTRMYRLGDNPRLRPPEIWTTDPGETPPMKPLPRVLRHKFPCRPSWRNRFWP